MAERQRSKCPFRTLAHGMNSIPKLQILKLELKGDNADDNRDITFGFREIKAVGKEFQLNGRRIYFRGTHHGGDFPLTGYPPTDVAYWKKIFQINKDWGINHVRFHSFCPPEAAFQAADELGIYLQPEPGMWNEISPGTPMEKMLYEETEAMIRAYGNHPSFLLLFAEQRAERPLERSSRQMDRPLPHRRPAPPLHQRHRPYRTRSSRTSPKVRIFWQCSGSGRKCSAETRLGSERITASRLMT